MSSARRRRARRIPRGSCYSRCSERHSICRSCRSAGTTRLPDHSSRWARPAASSCSSRSRRFASANRRQGRARRILVSGEPAVGGAEHGGDKILFLLARDGREVPLKPHPHPPLRGQTGVRPREPSRWIDDLVPVPVRRPLHRICARGRRDGGEQTSGENHLHAIPHNVPSFYGLPPPGWDYSIPNRYPDQGECRRKYRPGDRDPHSPNFAMKPSSFPALSSLPPPRSMPPEKYPARNAFPATSAATACAS